MAPCCSKGSRNRKDCRTTLHEDTYMEYETEKLVIGKCAQVKLVYKGRVALGDLMTPLLKKTGLNEMTRHG